ncbi:NAD-dependent epimerase/dehydratase family protein [Janibacter melonis]|uniref:NAD-dependent epimerase/dehydratase family protein n=1 Tax=Janibacter melonis TaxID=262209 RepID=UPI00174E5342
MSTRTATLLGCGDLGSRVGLRLAQEGVSVTGVRRDAAQVPPPIRGIAADLTDPDVDLPDLDADLLLVCLTADGRDEDAYRRTYVDGMLRGIEAVVRERTPSRAVLVSSTGVFGDVEGEVDESTPPAPSRPTARVLLEAERAFAEALPHGVVARLSGLYGRPHPRVVDEVRRGDDRDPGRWTNRVHRDDAASALAHLLTRVDDPHRLYVVTDDEPCTSGELRALVAAELGVPWPEGDDVTPVGRRLSNARLRATGWQPEIPSYREGYPPLVAGS